MKNNFFSAALQATESRLKIATPTSSFCLDKNEQSEDVAMEYKKTVLDSLMNASWNRYPSNDLSDIEQNVASYCGLQPENIVLSSGSANMITTLLNYFAINQKNIIITQPSYSLFDYHCKTYNIPYQPWMLTKGLEFDVENLPSLNAESVLIITAPNNPTGNSIKLHELENILISNPDSIIIVDGVYTEFGDADFTPLVNKYDNLIVLRSFSKAFPAAGLRLGYLCATPKIAAVIKKLILQFSINPLTLIFAREVLFNTQFMEDARQRVAAIISERQRMYHYLKANFKNALQVFPSQGNFLLMRVSNKLVLDKVMEGLTKTGIKVLSTTNFSLLENTFRVSVGNQNENEVFMYALSKIMKQISIESQQNQLNNIQLPAALLQPISNQIRLN